MSYSTKFRIILLSVMALGLLIALFLRSGTETTPEAVKEPVAAVTQSPGSETVADGGEGLDVAAPNPGEWETEEVPFHQSAPLPAAPSVDAARKEVEKNPHAPPQSLLQFANQIADRFDDVEKNPDQAEGFMNELEECVRDSGNRLLSARALCLTNAEDLGAMFPQLAERLNQLKGSAPAEVRDLARATSMGYEE